MSTTAERINELKAIVDGPFHSDDLVLHATPYGYDAPVKGFYFSSVDEYDQKLEAAKELQLLLGGNGDFEHEVQFIEGPLFMTQDITDSFDVSNLETLFDLIDTYVNYCNEHERASIQFLLDDRHSDLIEAMELSDNVILHCGTAEDAVHDYIEEYAACQSIHGDSILKRYFDCAAFARDCELNGEWCEFVYNGETYTVLNARSF